MMSMVPVAILSVILQSRIVHSLMIESTTAMARMSAKSLESMTNIRTVRSFARELFEKFGFARRLMDNYRILVRSTTAVGIATTGTWICVNVTFCMPASFVKVFFSLT